MCAVYRCAARAALLFAPLLLCVLCAMWPALCVCVLCVLCVLCIRCPCCAVALWVSPARPRLGNHRDVCGVGVKQEAFLLCLCTGIPLM